LLTSLSIGVRGSKYKSRQESCSGRQRKHSGKPRKNTSAAKRKKHRKKPKKSARVRKKGDGDKYRLTSGPQEGQQKVMRNNQCEK